MKHLFGVLSAFVLSANVFAAGPFTEKNIDHYSTRAFFAGLDLAFTRAGSIEDYNKFLEQLDADTAKTGIAGFLRQTRDSADPKAQFVDMFSQMNTFIQAQLKSKNINISFAPDMDEMNKARALRMIRETYKTTGYPKAQSEIQMFVSSDLETKMNALFQPSNTETKPMSERLGWSAERSVFETYHSVDLPQELPAGGLQIVEFDSNAKMIKFKHVDVASGGYYQIDPSKVPVTQEVKYPEWMKDGKAHKYVVPSNGAKIAVSGYPVKKSEIEDARVIRVSNTGEMELRQDVKTEPSDLGLFVDSPEKVIEALNATKKISSSISKDVFDFELPELRPHYCKEA